MRNTLKAKLLEERRCKKLRRSIFFSDKELWWEIQGPEHVLPQALKNHDVLVNALIFYCMSNDLDLHVEGSVSDYLLESIDEFSAYWATWRPDLYKKVTVTADQISENLSFDTRAKEKAVLAFSGGVDATFSLLRHKTGYAGRRSKDIHAAVLVQGFDIPLDNTAAFTISAQSANEALAAFEVPLVIVRTNWREIVCNNWEMEFGTAVAAILRHWEGAVTTGLLGSDEDVNHLPLPWGGNPITYAQLSTNSFRVAYDGGEFNRTQKVAFIATHEAAANNLRVCWQGTITGKNCGHCEKCIRTKLNFMASGLRLPRSLARLPNLLEILRLKSSNTAQLIFLEEIAAEAAKNNIRENWLPMLKVAILNNKARILAKLALGKIR